MRLRMILGLMCVVALAACQGPPPTVVYIVVTPTPNETDIARESTRDAAVTLVAQADAPIWLTATAIFQEQTANGAVTGGTEVGLLPTASPDVSTPASSATPVGVTSTPGATALPPNFPTPVIAQIQVAEQLFEGGRMFWIQPTGQLWVMTVTSEGRGDWTIYEDTYVEGEPEIDESLVPPEGRYQPERGFGKLWREGEGLRETLGWGVTPEFGYVSRYEYRAGGSVDPTTGVYTPGPGYHILFSLGGELFRFNEADGTWQLGDS